MGHASTWKDPSTHITYKRGDKITITGTIYYSADGVSGTWGYYKNYTCYFYSHYTASWTVKAPICIGTSKGSAWAFVKASAIKSGGTKESYAIKYNANGGSGAPAAQTKYYGTDITLSSTKPTRTGYTFKNWNTSADGTGTAYAAGGTYKKNKAITLYAQWTQNTYAITYNANGGSGAPVAQTKTYGVNLTLSSTKPTRTGFNFVNWNTNSAGTGSSYSAGGTYSANSAATLYAQWNPYTHTVAFNANGGSGAPASQTKTYGSTITLSSTKPTRSGYTFVKWNTKKDGTGTSYSPGQTYGSDQNGGTVTLYAIWSADTYTISYNANGGSGAPATQSKTHGVALILSSTIPTRAGYKFAGWNTNAAGNGTTYAAGSTYTGNASATLYAQWKVDNICCVKTPSGWKYGIAYIKINGKWVQGEHVYVKVNGTWKMGIR